MVHFKKGNRPTNPHNLNFNNLYIILTLNFPPMIIMPLAEQAKPYIPASSANFLNQIAEIEKVQKNHFQVLSEEDQKKTCEVVGMKYLERAISAGEEILPAVSELKVSEKPKEALQDGVTTFREIDKRLEALRGAPQVHDKRTKSPQDKDKTLQMQNERANRWRNAVEFVPRPHKRVEALHGTTASPPKAYVNQAQNQQGLCSEVKPQLAVMQASLSSSAYGPEIEEVLRQNLERQHMVKQELARSKEDILQMQEDIKRGEKMAGRRLPRVNFDVEAFLREREVERGGGD